MGLFGSSQKREHRPAVTEPAVPAGTRVYAIGDIHGRLDLLKDLEYLIGEHAHKAPVARKCIVYLGDYVDRGMQSKEVIDHLLEGPPAGFEAVYLKGNHEEFLLHFLEDVRIGPSWIANGGGATLYSYGARSPEQGNEQDRLSNLRVQLLELLPPSHFDFMSNLPLSHVEGDYYFVHAGVRPGVPLGEQRAEDMLWIRHLFLDDTRDYGKIVVHGHTITDAPVVLPNRIGIDTGAYASGVLTCLVLEGTARDFIHTGY
ncbi:MAG TPA: metallophosphoesterase family protein [Alphaproteobacteria bacterium]|nr:metallophosphoesterase family protein [Alphaproteobacteria bacterium]